MIRQVVDKSVIILLASNYLIHENQNQEMHDIISTES